MAIDAKLEKPFAFGRTAEVHSWKENRILKLFHEPFAEGHVQYEARVARAVQATGLPVPAVGEIVEVNGRMGIEYELVAGRTLMAEMAARPWRIATLSRLLAALHARLHEVGGIEGIPLQRERLERKIEEASGLSRGLRRRALQHLQRMPQCDRLCHGDFHPGNVILSDKGPVIIDWIDVTLGNPLADVARTSVLAEGELASGPSLSWLVRVGLRLAHREYVRHYFQERPGKEAYRRWRPIVSAARMNEGIEELEAWLRAQVEIGLATTGDV